MDIISIMNTIRANASADYQQRVPSATRTNLSQLGGTILEYQALTNEFVSALVNRIAFPIVQNRTFNNPLAVLKKGRKPYGTDIEEIYTNPATAMEFSDSDATDLLTIQKPDVKTVFHRMNRRNKYKTTISMERLQKAFLSMGEMSAFIESIISTLYSGNAIDEFMLMKNLVGSAIAGNKIASVDVTYNGDEGSSKEFVKTVKTLSTSFTLPSTSFNGYNMANAEAISAKTITPATTWCPPENQVILIRADVDAATDVEVLAKAFNLEYTKFLPRKIVVDSFGDNNTLAMIADDAWFRIYDDLFQIRQFENGSGLYTNYFLHSWQTISASLFANAIAIKTA